LCNSGNLRDRLSKRLIKTCDLSETQVTLPPESRGLYGFLHNAVTPATETLLVSGFEELENLDSVLTAANQIREEFRKQFHFPMVWWVSEEIHGKLQRLAPDLFSWANTTVFKLSTQELIDFIDNVTTEAFGFGLDRGAIRPLDYVHSDLGLTAPKAREVKSACRELQNRGVTLNERLQASVAFINCLGHEPLSAASLRAYEACLKRWQTYYDSQNSPSAAPQTDAEAEPSRRKRRSINVFANLDIAQITERYAYVQYSLGVWWRNYAIHYPFYYQPACELAEDFFQVSLTVLAQSNRDDLRAKFINALGDIFERLQEWEQLIELAQDAIALHQSYPNPFRLARGYSFAAAAALGQKNYAEAIAFAQQALDLSAQTPPDSLIPKAQIPNREWVRSYNRGYYHFILAQARLAQGEISAGLEHLEQAKADTSPQYEPRLYLDVLQVLHDAYFETGDYLTAYHYKKQRRSVEQQFGFSAFVGAVQLRPSQAFSSDEQPDLAHPATGAVAPEIRASGREADINNIRERLSRTEYKLTILYGPSGVGKSSLIRAGLLPALRSQSIATRDLLVVHSRIYTNWSEQLLKEFNQQLTQFPTYHDRSLKVVQHCETLAAMHQQCQANADQNHLLTVLVFDQFEEFFVSNKSSEERRSFYDFFATCLEIPYVKILLSLREDYLFYLLELSRYRPLAAINHNILDKNILYYIGNFTQAQAHDIITQLTAQAHFYIESALIGELVNQLANAQLEIRPVELQVVGEQLQAENITTLAQYQAKGTKEWLVQRHLAAVIADCGPDNAAIAQLVLYVLTDEDNTRPLKTRQEIEQAIERLGSNSPIATLDLVLDILVEAGMVFLIPSAYGNQYQVVHDYLVPFIRKQQEENREAQLRESERQRHQSEQRRILSEARLNQLFRFTSIGSVALALIMAVMSIWLWKLLLDQRSARFAIASSEIEALTNSSQALFRSNRVFDALIDALKSSRKLQTETAIGGSQRTQVMSALQQSIFWVQERNRLAGHQGTIRSVRFSPDGDRLVSASSDETVRLWSREGELLAVLDDHTGPANAAVFHPQDQTLITAGSDRLQFWSTIGELEGTLNTPHQQPITKLAISPDGRYFASSDLGGEVVLWSIDRQVIHHWQDGAQEPITALTFTADGQAVVAGSHTGEIRVWSVQGYPLSRWQAHQHILMDIAVHPRSAHLLSASADGTLKHWSLTGQLQQEQEFDVGLLAVRYAPDGQTLALSFRNKSIQLMEPNGRILKTLDGHTAQVLSLDFSPDGRWLTSGGGDQLVRLWDTTYDFINVQHQGGEPTAVQFAPDGQSYAVVSNTGQLTLHYTKGQRHWHQTLSNKPLTTVRFNPQGTAMAVAGDDGTIWLWRTEQPGQFPPQPSLIIPEAHTRIIRGIAFSHDGQMLASVSDDKTAKIWSLTGELDYTFLGHKGGVSAIAFHPQNRNLVIGNVRGGLEIWTPEGELKKTLVGHHGPITDVVFSPNGRLLASAARDNTVKLWSAQGQLRKNLTQHEDYITQVAFSPDSQRLASASVDQSVNLWDVDGTLITTLRGHQWPVVGLSFHPSQPWLLTASRDQRLILWDLQLVGNLDLLVEQGCAWVSHYLETNSDVDAEQRQLCEGVEAALLPDDDSEKTEEH
ncbi:MAG: hypothetical protein F6J87_29730, partial [Spirulina sp. SIO3F2]|nr:hypothetical protein [Spirulina sp. SIO3F2]